MLTSSNLQNLIILLYIIFIIIHIPYYVQLPRKSNLLLCLFIYCFVVYYNYHNKVILSYPITKYL